MRTGGSNRQNERMRQSLIAQGVEFIDAGAVTIGSKARHFIIKESDIEKAKQAGLTMSKIQWEWLKS